jgi:hypothetical protein
MKDKFIDNKIIPVFIIQEKKTVYLKLIIIRLQVGLEQLFSLRKLF